MYELQLDQIKEKVVQTYRQAQQDYMKRSNNKRLNTWHVSDFVSECIRKTYYSKLHPEKFSPEKQSLFWFGHIVHEHTPLSKINELTMCYDIETDMALTPEEVLEKPFDQLGTIITGTLDDLMKINGEFVIADKKTFTGGGYYKKTSPDYSYELQLNIYRVLLKESYGIDAKYGCLLYLDKTSNLDPTPIPFELKPVEQTKLQMKEILYQLRSGQTPAPNVCWLCNGKNKKGQIYCSYVDLCKQDGGRTE
jgi:ATP-dependent exoDNAse (exonuclease V) beta subunit